MITNILEMYIRPSREEPHHRYNSWRHCYRFFETNFTRLQEEEIQEMAALHLGFYLASWGMMRGSSVLLQKDYRVHLKFIRMIAGHPEYRTYYSKEGKEKLSEGQLPQLLELMDATRACYDDIMKASDTLVTKILLGVFANVPAYDRYFIEGLKLHGMQKSCSAESLQELVRFFYSYQSEFEPYIADGYPPMKLLDMYFWQSAMWEEQVTKRKQHTVQGSFLAKPNQTDSVRRYLVDLLGQKRAKGFRTVEIRSGDIHETLQLTNSLPTVCNAMKTLPYFRYETVESPPKGNGANLIVRYIID